ncbi:MAG: gene transfer agent family protein [Pseudomonadota bacterium]
MVNPLRGEISAELDGKSWTLCLTLGALAGLEKTLGVADLSQLSAKFASGKLSAEDILKIIHAGLIGGGYTLSQAEASEMRVDGGVQGYVDIAARLLTATFTPPEISE